MPVPKAIKIAGHRIAIKRPKNLKSVNSEYGYFDPDSMTIYIDAGVEGDHEGELFFHEAIEAANVLFELGLPHQTIQILGVVLHQIEGQL